MQIVMSNDCPWRPVNDSGILYFTAGKFADGEITVKFEDSRVGEKQFLIIHSLFPDPNTRLIELLLVINCLQSMTSEIRVLLPYMCYSRQDRATENCSAISHKAVLGMLQSCGAKYIFTFDAHSHSMYNQLLYLDCAAEFMRMVKYEDNRAFLIDIVTSKGVGTYLLKVCEFEKDAVIVINDNGRRPMVDATRKFLDIGYEDMVYLGKNRRAKNGMCLYLQDGDVENKTCLLIDDIVDSGETICRSADVLKQNGAKRVIVFVTHAVFSGEGKNRIASCNSIDLFVTTDSIVQSHGQNITTLPIVETLVKQIQDQVCGCPADC